MQSALQLWARSSMAEQWPFKPFVESSTLSELTRSLPIWKAFLFCCESPQREWYSTLSNALMILQGEWIVKTSNGKMAGSANKEKFLRVLEVRDKKARRNNTHSALGF